jgi:hypothetical protein
MLDIADELAQVMPCLLLLLWDTCYA